MKKKTALAAMIFALALCVLTACNSNVVKKPFGQAANEIFTYQKIDYSKTQLVVSTTGNISTGTMNAEFMKKYPDIQIINIDLTGGEVGYVPAQQVVENGYVPDIMITAGNFLGDSYLEKYFVDLSANPITARFQTAVLSDIAVNDRLYSLPGLSKLSAIIYNKTLFADHGWEVPTTVDEFFTLCNTINTTTEIEAFNPNAKYSEEFTTFLEALSYDDVFAGVENRQWLKDFITGKATYAEHMQPLYDVMQRMIDTGVLNESHFTYSATTRGQEFLGGKIAMINNKITDFVSDEYEFGVFAFPAAEEGDEGWVLSSLDSEIAVPKKERSAAVQDAVDKYLAFYASVEGQKAYIGQSALFSNLKMDLFTADDSPLTAGLKDEIDAGHKFSSVKFSDDDNTLNISFRSEALAVLKGERTAAQSMAYIDQTCRQVKQVSAPTVVAKAAEDFTVLQVSSMFADMFREETGADIGLIANNVAYRGNLMRIYKGDINAVMVKVLQPRSYANGAQLVKVKMTGEKLLAALDKPLGNGYVNNCIYAFSGLKCTVAPWNTVGSKMVSVTLADGTPIDPAKTYTVACWQGTVYDEFITETVQTYGNYNNSTTQPDNTFVGLLTKYLTTKGTVSPAKDGRITINWD